MNKGSRRHTRFVTSCAAGAFMVAGWASSAAAAEPCAGGVGQWAWFIGGQVTVSQDNTVRYSGNGSIPPATGAWTCDPKDGKYVVTWQNGFVDTLSLSPDGTKLTGTSSTGAAVSGARARSSSSTTAKPAAPNTTANQPPTTTSKPPSSSGAVDHNPSVREILQGRPKPDPNGWKQDRSGGPQKGPKPFEGWQ